MLKKDEDYEKVFSAHFPIEVFRASIELSRQAEAHLRADTSLTAEDRVNLKFYVAMYVAALAAGVSKPTPEQIKALAGANIDKALFGKACEQAKKIYQSLGGDGRVAKGAELGEKLIAQLEQGLGRATAEVK